MFGFLSPRPHSFAYRQSYARLCMHQRQCYGLASLPFHSFEAVFLYQIATDAGAVPANVLPNTRCCKLSCKENVTKAADAEIGRYCASVAVLLASVKLNDDVRDSGSWPARATRFVMRSRIAQAERHFQRVDAQLLPTVSKFITTHHLMEQSTNPIPLVNYVEPTTFAFGEVFHSMASVANIPQYADVLTEIGRGVGAALLAYDAAIDWPRDRVKGEYNPLPDHDAVERALSYSASELDGVAEKCRLYFGRDSQAAATATRVGERVRARIANPEGSCIVAVSPWKQLRMLAQNSLRSLATGELALAGVHAMSNENEESPSEPGEKRRGKKAWSRPEETAAEEKVKQQGSTGGGPSACGGTCEGCALIGNCCECIACCA